MIATCPVCRRSLALGDRSGRHVASEAHYPHVGASGAMACSPPTGEVQRSVPGESRPASLRPVNDQNDLKHPRPADDEG